MEKYEISINAFTTINMYRAHGLTTEEVYGLITKQQNIFTEVRESFDDQKAARKAFDETYRPQAISRRVEDWRTMHVLIIFYDLSAAEYDENGELISEKKLLDRAVEALPSEAQEKNAYEKIGTWKGNMDLEQFVIENRYRYEWKQYRHGKDIDLIRFTDRHRMDLYGRVFALYGFVENYNMKFYRFCWEVNPDNLNEALNGNKIYIFYPIHKPTYGFENGVHWDGESAEPVDFIVHGPNSQFVVYTAEFDFPDVIHGRIPEDKIEEIFDRHPSPVITERGNFNTPQEAFDARSYLKSEHEKKDNHIRFHVSYIQEENENGTWRMGFYAPTLYN